MYLKKALWVEGRQPEKGSPKNEADPPVTVVGELVNSLTEQRVYREVTLALRTGLRDAQAEFSFVRLRGLKRLLKFLRSVAESDSTINLFTRTQSVPELQGLFLLTRIFKISLRGWKFSSFSFLIFNVLKC